MLNVQTLFTDQAQLFEHWLPARAFGQDMLPELVDRHHFGDQPVLAQPRLHVGFILSVMSLGKFAGPEMLNQVVATTS